MANIRAIRTHIKSVESTGKITKSMKMVAAAKLKRTQSAMNALRPYAAAAGEMLSQLSADPSLRDNPFLRPRQIGKVCYVVFVGNRGLCGVYNTALVKYLQGLLEKETRPYFLLVCGRWGRDVFAASALPVRETVEDLPDAPTTEDARRLSRKLKSLYLSGEAEEINLVYERYCSALRQEPDTRRLLPLMPRENGGTEKRLILEPDGKSLAERLVELYLDNTVHATLLEVKTGEHTARMTAMTAASDNTDQLLSSLRLALNHARQAAITTEISEIVGGANALQSDEEEKRAKG